MLDFRGQPRLAQETLVRIAAGRNLRADDLHHARRAEEGVLDLENLAHAADAEALHDAVLAVDRLVGVLAKKVGERLAAVGTGFVIAVDLSAATDARDSGHERWNDSSAGVRVRRRETSRGASGEA